MCPYILSRDIPPLVLVDCFGIFHGTSQLFGNDTIILIPNLESWRDLFGDQLVNRMLLHSIYTYIPYACSFYMFYHVVVKLIAVKFESIKISILCFHTKNLLTILPFVGSPHPSYHGGKGTEFKLLTCDPMFLTYLAIGQLWFSLDSVPVCILSHLIFPMISAHLHFGYIRSIPRPLMPWLLVSPGHRQPWYWLCRMNLICLCLPRGKTTAHDDVIKWKHFPRYWPFVRGIHRSPANSFHKGQGRRALMFSMIYVWTNGCANNRDAGDLRRHRAYYDVIVMYLLALWNTVVLRNVRK